MAAPNRPPASAKPRSSPRPSRPHHRSRARTAALASAPIGTVFVRSAAALQAAICASPRHPLLQPRNNRGDGDPGRRRHQMPAAEPSTLLISEAEIEELREMMGVDPAPPRRRQYASGADMPLEAIAARTGTSRQGIANTEARALERLAAVASLRLGYPAQDVDDLVIAFVAGPATKEELRIVRNPDRRTAARLLGAKPGMDRGQPGVFDGPSTHRQRDRMESPVGVAGSTSSPSRLAFIDQSLCQKRGTSLLSILRCFENAFVTC